MKSESAKRATAFTALFVSLLCLQASVQSEESHTRFQRVYDLKSGEIVFAYSRISPDGKLLAYTSQREQPNGGQSKRITRIVELSSGRTVFAKDGIDAYWSPTGDRFVFLSHASDSLSVSIVVLPQFKVHRDVAPADIGDYFSWGILDQRDVIMTINGRFVELAGNRATGRVQRVPFCSGVGEALRPLISRNAKRITSFSRGRLVIRNVGDCADILRTNISGAKADFSADGRYIAYHTLKSNDTGYEIQVADLIARRIIKVTDLPGSSYFPSWTDDGRLLFRYESAEYRGFIMASEFLRNPSTVFPAPAAAEAADWADIFPDTPRPEGWQLVTVWSAWSSHSPEALREVQVLFERSSRRKIAFSVAVAVEPFGNGTDAFGLLEQEKVRVPSFRMTPRGLRAVGGVNQMPMNLIFRDGQLAGQLLGAQSASALRTWVQEVASAFDHNEPPGCSRTNSVEFGHPYHRGMNRNLLRLRQPKSDLEVWTQYLWSRAVPAIERHLRDVRRLGPCDQSNARSARGHWHRVTG